MSRFSVLLDNALELLIEADPGRRRFLKTMGSVAASTATSNPSRALKAVAGMAFEDSLANIPDDVLRDTPEEEWITKVPYSRFNRIINGDKDYASQEISNKLMYLVSYGTSHNNKKDIIKILLRGLKDNNIEFDPTSIYDFVLPYLKYAPNLKNFDGGLKEAMQESIGLGRELFQLTDELGIPIDKRQAMSEIRRHTVEYYEDRFGGESREEEAAEPESSYNKPEEYEHYNIPHDYQLAAPMHQTFESRLRKALRI